MGINAQTKSLTDPQMDSREWRAGSERATQRVGEKEKKAKGALKEFFKRRGGRTGERSGTVQTQGTGGQEERQFDAGGSSFS